MRVGRKADRQTRRQCATEARVADVPDLSRPLALALGDRVVGAGPIDRCIRIERRHVERLPIGALEQGDRVIVQIRSVIHRPHAGANRGLDAVCTMGMGRHHLAPASCLHDSGPDLLIRVLPRPWRDALREDGTGRENLDEVGAVLEIGANRARDFVGAIGEVADDRHVDIRRKLSRIPSATSRRDIVAGDHHPRSRHRVFFDRAAQLDVDIWPGGSHVADRGESSQQRDSGVASAPQRIAWRRRFHQRILPVHARVAREVRVEIDEPRQERGVTQVDHLRTGHHAHVWPDLGDALTVDANRCGPYGRRTRTVDQLRGSDDRDPRRWRLSDEGPCEQRQDQRHAIHGASDAATGAASRDRRAPSITTPFHGAVLVCGAYVQPVWRAPDFRGAVRQRHCMTNTAGGRAKSSWCGARTSVFVTAPRSARLMTWMETVT